MIYYGLENFILKHKFLKKKELNLSLIFIPIILVIERIANKEVSTNLDFNPKGFQFPDQTSKDGKFEGTVITPENLESIPNELERAFARIFLSQEGFKISHDVRVGSRLIDFCIEVGNESPRKALFEIKKSPRNNSQSTRAQKKALRESGYPYEIFYESDLSDPELVLKKVWAKLLRHSF